MQEFSFTQCLVRVGLLLRWCALVLVLGLGCGPTFEVGADFHEVRIRTWWDSGVEDYPQPRRSLEELLSREFSILESNPTTSRQQALGIVAAAFDAGTPLPHSFLGSAGRDILQWSPCGVNAGDGDRLVPLSDNRSLDWFYETFEPWMVNSLRCNAEGPVYGMPLVVHRMNTVYYSAVRAETENIQWENLSIEEFIALEQPFAIPEGEAELVNFFVEGLMGTALGAEQFENFWQRSPSTPVNWDKVDTAIDYFINLSPRLRAQSAIDATTIEDLLEREVILAFFTGDWFYRTQKQDNPVGLAGFPGGQSVSIRTVEAFAVPVQDDTNPGLAWVASMSDRTVQERVADNKAGARPARSDLQQGLTTSTDSVSVPAMIALLGGTDDFSELGRHLLRLKEDPSTGCGPGIDHGVAGRGITGDT